MLKLDLTSQDHELVKIACDAAKRPVLHINNEKCPALVTSAARLDNGDVVTGSNLMTDVGSISMCAEPFAINEANRREGRSVVSIVAVYHQPGFEPKVIPPCGRCREVIVDFMPNGHVILRDPGSEKLYKVKPPELLPLRYGDFWKGDTLT
ncbi:MAG: hypothetical protein ACAH80_10310 [Alphaproteobacteria bacterium]